MNRMCSLSFPQVRGLAPMAQRGAALVEFALVGPVITLIGLAVLQYALLFFAKNQLNYAAFMAARAGSMAHADLGTVQAAYLRALVPLYGGGQSTSELAGSYARAAADAAGHLQIQLLNPTKESFDDWNDPALQQGEGRGKRVIPNDGLALKVSGQIGSASGQTLQDANLIKLRITQGVKPVVPFVGTIYTKFMQWADPHTDAFHTAMLAQGRLPVLTQATVLMQSNAFEQAAVVSSPGLGNNGLPTDPGNPPAPTEPPPQCATIGCTVTASPPASTGGGNVSCNPLTDPSGCLPLGCQKGDASCDPVCGTSAATYCCVSGASTPN